MFIASVEGVADMSGETVMHAAKGFSKKGRLGEEWGAK